MDFKDLPGWRERLTAGTSPEMSDKLNEAAASMEQIIVPLQWTSTATPLVAKVRTHKGDVFTVDTFVSVQTKNAQSPEGLQSTATYVVTVDAGRNWLITDVGGINAMAPK